MFSITTQLVNKHCPSLPLQQWDYEQDTGSLLLFFLFSVWVLCNLRLELRFSCLYSKYRTSKIIFQFSENDFWSERVACLPAKGGYGPQESMCTKTLAVYIKHHVLAQIETLGSFKCFPLETHLACTFHAGTAQRIKMSKAPLFLTRYCQKMHLPQSHTALEVLRDFAGGRGQDTHPGPSRLSTLSSPPEDMLGLGFSQFQFCF